MSGTQSRSARTSKWQIVKWLLLSLLALILVIMLAIWLFAGKITVSYLNDYLQDSNQVTISPQSELTFNPFLSRLTMRNFELVKRGKTVFFVKHLQLSYLFMDILTKNVIFDEASIDNLFINANLTENQIAGINLEPESPEKESAEPDSGPMEWQIRLPHLTLTDTQFEAVTKDRNDVIGIDLFELKDLHFQAEKLDLQMLLRASINTAPVKLAFDIALDNPLTPETLTADAVGSYQLKAFDTAQYASFLPETIETLLGLISVEGDIKAKYDGQSIQLRQSNNLINIQNGSIGLPGLDAETGSIQVSLANLDINVKQNADPESAAQISASATPHLTVNRLALNYQNLSAPEAANSQANASAEATTTTAEAAPAPKTTPATPGNPTEGATLNLQLLEFDPGEVAIQTEQDSLSVTANKSTMQVNGLDLNLQPVIIESASQQLHLDTFSLQQDAEHLTLTLAPALESGSTQIYLYHAKNLAAAWESMSLAPAEISVKEGKSEITLPLISFSQLQASRPVREELPQPLVQTEQLTIANSRLVDNHLAIDQINFGHSIAEVILTAKRKISNLIDTDSQPADEQQDKTKTIVSGDSKKSDQNKNSEAQTAKIDTPENDADATPFTFSFGQIVVSPQSRIKFIDRLRRPPFEKELILAETTFGPMDSRNPNTESNIVLAAKIGDYGELKASGHIKPLTDKTNLNLRGNIKEIALPPLSFYVREALEYNIESGQLNTNFDVKIVDDRIKGNAKVLLRSFELVAPDSKKTTAESGAISLNIAVDMLKDSKGNIKLKIPIKGDVSSPTFGVGTFLAIIMKKALMVAAQEVLLQSLMPYAGIASLAIEAGSELIKVKFAPLPYRVEQVAPDQAQEDYLVKFAEVMKKQKTLQVRMCAITVPGDIGIPPDSQTILTEEQKEALLNLGIAREKQLKSALIKKGVESSRLFECRPKISKDAKATPSIKLVN